MKIVTVHLVVSGFKQAGNGLTFRGNCASVMKKLLRASNETVLTKDTLIMTKVDVNAQTQSPAVKRIQVELEGKELDAVKGNQR